MTIALKPDDIQALKSKFGFNPQDKFVVPKEIYDLYDSLFGNRGAALESKWTALLDQYVQKYPKEHAELTRRIAGKLPDGWEKSLPVYQSSDPAQASRKLSEIVLTAITSALPELMGGSADLTGSNLTKVKGTVEFQPPGTGLGTYAGTYIRYGVREHAMGAIGNGLAAYGGIIPFVATFLVCDISRMVKALGSCVLQNFVSYASGAWRLSALSGHQVIWVGKYIASHSTRYILSYLSICSDPRLHRSRRGRSYASADRDWNRSPCYTQSGLLASSRWQRDVRGLPLGRSGEEDPFSFVSLSSEPAKPPRLLN